jgi:tRNA G18 (ribose-2'-O)-methylase SpoU
MKPIKSCHDIDIALYRNYRDKDLREKGLFITEGKILTDRLIDSNLKAHSILTSIRFMDDYRHCDIPVFYAEEDVLKDIAGFNFHRGVLGLGHIPTQKNVSNVISTADQCNMVICPEITDDENLGSIIRNAAALGADAVICGEECCSPFSRRSLRVAMGSQFFIDIIICSDIQKELQFIKDNNFTLYGTALSSDAGELRDIEPEKRNALVLGREGPGLSEKILKHCHKNITLPMKNTVDSLNVASASAIFMYELFYRNR